jgi:hypothetical protein
VQGKEGSGLSHVGDCWPTLSRRASVGRIANHCHQCQGRGGQNQIVNTLRAAKIFGARGAPSQVEINRWVRLQQLTKNLDTITTRQSTLTSLASSYCTQNATMIKVDDFVLDNDWGLKSFEHILYSLSIALLRVSRYRTRQQTTALQDLQIPHNCCRSWQLWLLLECLSPCPLCAAKQGSTLSATTVSRACQ